MRLLTVLIALAAIGAVVFLFAVSRYPALVGVELVAAGRYDKVCSPISAVRGLWVRSNVVRSGERIKTGSSLLKEDGAFQQWRTPMGDYWIPADTVAAIPALLGQQAAGEYGEIRRGDVVLDAGAHVGFYTRGALEMGASQVVAIEPSPDNIECLRRNFAQEIQVGRVIVYSKGVWDKEDTLILHRVRGNSAGDSLVLKLGKGEDVKVPLTTIDRLVDELRLDRVDFIKMDIKGAERQALSGATKTLARFGPRIAVASEHLPDDTTELPAIVRRADPQYRATCGCSFLEEKFIRPEILFFER